VSINLDIYIYFICVFRHFQSCYIRRSCHLRLGHDSNIYLKRSRHRLFAYALISRSVLRKGYQISHIAETSKIVMRFFCLCLEHKLLP